MAKVAGVYIIMCTVNRKVYIGSTCNIVKRLGRHRNKLSVGGYAGSPIQADYDQYGRDYFVFDTLEEVKEATPEVLIQREAHWSIVYNAFDKDHGYNIRYQDEKIVEEKDYNPINRNTVRERRVVEEIDYLSNTSGEPFFMMDIITGSIELFMNIGIFKRIYDWDERRIYSALNYWDSTITEEEKHGTHGKYLRSYRGYMFIYAVQYQPEFNYLGYKKKPSRKKEKIAVPMADRALGRKQVRVIASDSSEAVYESATEAARVLGVEVRKVTDVCKGYRRMYKGYHFEYTGICDRDNNVVKVDYYSQS